MRALEKMLAKAKKLRDRVKKYHSEALRFERIDHEVDVIAYEHNYDGRFIALYDNRFNPRVSAKWHAEWFEHALNTDATKDAIIERAVRQLERSDCYCERTWKCTRCEALADIEKLAEKGTKP
jgi:hypothetical protein